MKQQRPFPTTPTNATAVPQIDLTTTPDASPFSSLAAAGKGQGNVGVVAELVEASGEEEDGGQFAGMEAGMAELPTAEAPGG